MLRLISRLATITIFSFLCALIYTNLAVADPGSSAMEILKGTGSTGSFSYEEDQGKKGAIGYGVNNQKHEGSKSKSYSHGSKGYSGHISGSESHKKSEGSKSKSYSHGKPGHGKSSHAYKGGHGKSYGHKSKSHPHGGHNQNPFQHVLHFKKKLGLTNSQIQSMKELELDFKKKGIQADADHEIAHLELDRHVHSGELDEAKIRAAGAKIVASKTNKIMAMIDAKIQLLKLLTAEQRQKMAKMH